MASADADGRMRNANARLVAAREFCKEQQRAVDAMADPEKRFMHTGICKSFLRSGMLGILAPYVELAYSKFQELGKPYVTPKAGIAMPVMPTENFKRGLGWDGLSARESSVVEMLCNWRLAQIWHGANTPASLKTFEAVHNTLDNLASLDPSVCDSLVVVMCFNACVQKNNQAGGNISLIARGDSRRYLNQSSALLQDPFSVYLLTTMSTSPAIYAMADIRVRANLHLVMCLVMLTGDDILQLVPPELYTGPKRNREFQLLLASRRWYYKNAKRPKQPFLSDWDMGSSPEMGRPVPGEPPPPPFTGLTRKPNEPNVLLGHANWLQHYAPLHRSAAP